MLFNKSSTPVFLALALTFAVVLLSPRMAEAEEEGGISFGKVTFGKQSDSKWLAVDMRKTRAGTIGRAPTVNTYASTSRRSRSSTSYLNGYSAALATSTVPMFYPSASTMVSNQKLVQAAGIAVNNAHGHSTGSCWRYVKSALLKSEAITSYPKTGYAKQAASELVNDYGFVRTAISNPFSAPVGSVLVYGGAGAGHVEIRTRTGFVSDFVSAKPSSRPLLGVFVKR